MKRKRSQQCPNCNQEMVVPVAYGLPSPELFEEVEAGQVVLGGCSVILDENGESPQLRCKSCRTEFHKHRLGLRPTLQAMKADK